MWHAIIQTCDALDAALRAVLLRLRKHNRRAWHVCAAADFALWRRSYVPATVNRPDLWDLDRKPSPLIADAMKYHREHGGRID